MFLLGTKSSEEEAQAAVDRVREAFPDIEVEVVPVDRRHELRVKGAVGADFTQSHLSQMRQLVQEHVIVEPEGHPNAGQVRNPTTVRAGGEQIVEGSDRQTAPAGEPNRSST